MSSEPIPTNKVSDLETLKPGREISHKYFEDFKCKPIDIQWEDLKVSARIQKKVKVDGKKVTHIEEKPILKNINGCLKHGQFTAILGPSGSGKTTLLNFLSARIDHKLKITGSLKINSEDVNDIEKFGNLIAFVQQDDILMATITPREIFNFTANLRLSLSENERQTRVESLLQALGLQDCANTKVGNALIRGVSGGERKRTSIGVELITNPSLIFLDEPTTGLDSTTALKIMELLIALARSGRNVISTIHQPNSEIFSRFDNIMLLVRGNIIYQGGANTAVKYFEKIGYPCPKLTNPADFFMKVMNETGLVIDQIQAGTRKAEITEDEAAELETQFKERVDNMVEGYQKNKLYDASKQNVLTEHLENQKLYETSWFLQFYLITKRAFLNEIRNPMDVKMKILQQLIFGIIVLLLWNNISDDETGVQDRNGVLFLLATTSAFGAIQGSLGTFSLERPVFVRERLSKSYRTSAYFWGRAFSEIPFMALYPIILLCMTYWAVGLNTSSSTKFFNLLVIHWLAWFSGSGYGLLLSTVIPKLEVAVALIPVIIVPFFAFAGFFVNQDNIPVFFYPFEYLSIFKWAFQGSAINEFEDLKLNCNGCDPLGEHSFDESYGWCLAAMGICGVVLRILAYVGLEKISTPKKAKLVRE